jgi:hypothetical protein
MSTAMPNGEKTFSFDVRDIELTRGDVPHTARREFLH